MGSTRLWGKVLKKIDGKPLLAYLIERLKMVEKISSIIIATTTAEADKSLVDLAKNLGVNSFAGSEDDVLDRYYQACKIFKADIVIRVTGDCPLIDPKVIKKCLDVFLNNQYDYLSNTNPPTYPDGLDTEIFTFKALDKAWKNATLKSEREHVTPYIYKHPKDFSIFNVTNEEDWSNYRLTVDEIEDFNLISRIVTLFKDHWLEFSTKNVIDFLQKNPELLSLNTKFARNEGYQKSLKEDAITGTSKLNLKNGKSLWNKAKTLIPGGTQLLSKRSEMFAPNNWPSFFKKAKGVEVWDLDGNKYIDMTTMAVGACTLGYADDDVNAAVKKVIDDGSMCTLNSPEEVELAELLLKLHQWAGMVRYARTGGESMAIAVRIARAYTNKSTLAFCGYHGWHDWYLSANLADNAALDGHLLAGLEPRGVPRGLIKTSLPFEYNNLKKLQEIVATNDVGVIVLEPYRHQEPSDGFLQKVRQIADEIKAVLIFDEISIGWRLNVGGSHLVLGVIPDIAVVAKAMSNGYPMGAIIGKHEIMNAAQTSFISSTYWTERVGPTAALATIKKMLAKNVPAHLDRIGGLIGEGWKKLAVKHDLNIEILKPNALITFSFKYLNALEIKTFFTQEMLKRGFLAGPSVYVSYAHTEEHVKNYLAAVDDVFGKIIQGIRENKISQLLEGPVAHSGFQRLT